MSKKYEPATIHPQYDSNGLDSGLWILYATGNGYEEPIYENLSLFISRSTGKLQVGQFTDWDNESYDEDGCIDAECKSLGELTCPNPYQDDDAASYLYEWLKNTEAVTI